MWWMLEFRVEWRIGGSSWITRPSLDCLRIEERRCGFTREGSPGVSGLGYGFPPLLVQGADLEEPEGEMAPMSGSRSGKELVGGKGGVGGRGWCG